MARSSEAVEKMVGRRGATCLGWALLLITILLAIGVIASWTRSGEKAKPEPVPQNGR